MLYVKESPANTFAIIETLANVNLLPIQIPSIPAASLEPNGIFAVDDPAPPPSGKKIDQINFSRDASGKVIATATYVDINQQPPPPPPPPTGTDESAQNAAIAALQSALAALQTKVDNLPTDGTGGVSAPYFIDSIDPYNAAAERFGIKAVAGVDDTGQAAANTFGMEDTLHKWLLKTKAHSVELKFGCGTYAFAKPFRPDGALRIRGLSNGLGNANTIFRTPPGVDMGQIDGPATNGWFTEENPRYGATGLEIDGVTFWSRETPNAKVDPTYYRKKQANGAPTQGGVLLRTYATLRNVSVLGTPGYGFTHVGYSAANSGGNVNYCLTENCTTMWCGDFGMAQMGSDGNQNLFVRCNNFFNGGGGNADFSFLGNHFVSPGYDGNGWFGVLNAPYPSMCSFKTGDQWIVYQLLADNEGMGCLERAKTVQPGTDWGLWIDIGPVDGPLLVAPEWKPGMNWCVGGFHVKTNPNAVAGTIFGYTEDGSVRGQWNPPGVIIPGPNNTGWTKGSQQQIYITGIQ